jgi:hypothetical protein
MIDLLISAIKQTRYLVLRQATAAQGMAQPSTRRVYTLDGADHWEKTGEAIQLVPQPMKMKLKVD